MTEGIADNTATRPLSCFKAYDVRGRVPVELNENIVRCIGRATAQFLGARKLIVGYDIRLSSPVLAAALADGAREAGADVTDIGQCGSEEVYFATAHSGADGGVMVTASHNPADYNGLKIVGRDARPVSGDSGLDEIRELAEQAAPPAGNGTGGMVPASYRAEYVRHLLGYVDPAGLRPLRIVANAGNGGAGPVVDELEHSLPFEFIKINHEPDGQFPNGIPNPLLPENRAVTAAAVREAGADLGVAWDGDFDRCFLFDEKGGFVEGYYLVGLLAEVMLRAEPGAIIIHDPRLIWNTQELVTRAGGRPVQCKTGHAFIKERMRADGAVYGGEMSGHHYFRNFSFCDSGMIPWLLVAAELSADEKPLSELLAERAERFPCSGEINRSVPFPGRVLELVERAYAGQATSVDRTDGLGIDCGEWRFNLRASNTEPLLRLNVEARGDRSLMENKTLELLQFVDDSVAA